MGVYPDVTLKEARDRREAARKLLSNGIDPSKNRKAQKSARIDSAANNGTCCHSPDDQEWKTPYVKGVEDSNGIRRKMFWWS